MLRKVVKEDNKRELDDRAGRKLFVLKVGASHCYGSIQIMRVIWRRSRNTGKKDVQETQKTSGK